jgi:ABC-type bacteriocin/lantibiotic exporter with double-glycine peptidase domain
MLPLLVLVGALVMLSWLAWSPLTRTIRRIADQARRKKHDDDDNGEASNALLEDEFGDNNKRGLGCCLGKGLTVDAGATGAVAVVSAGSVVSKLLPYVLPEKWWLFSGSVALALATAMALGVPVLLRRVIDGVIVPASSSEVVTSILRMRPI